MNTKILVHLGQNIKKYRQKCGLTQERLAEKVKVHPDFEIRVVAADFFISFAADERALMRNLAALPDFIVIVLRVRLISGKLNSAK